MLERAQKRKFVNLTFTSPSFLNYNNHLCSKKADFHFYELIFSNDLSENFIREQKLIDYRQFLIEVPIRIRLALIVIHMKSDAILLWWLNKVLRHLFESRADVQVYGKDMDYDFRNYESKLKHILFVVDSSIEITRNLIALEGNIGNLEVGSILNSFNREIFTELLLSKELLINDFTGTLKSILIVLAKKMVDQEELLLMLVKEAIRAIKNLLTPSLNCDLHDLILKLYNYQTLKLLCNNLSNRDKYADNHSSFNDFILKEEYDYFKGTSNIKSLCHEEMSELNNYIKGNTGHNSFISTANSNWFKDKYFDVTSEYDWLVIPVIERVRRNREFVLLYPFVLIYVIRNGINETIKLKHDNKLYEMETIKLINQCVDILDAICDVEVKYLSSRCSKFSSQVRNKQIELSGIKEMRFMKTRREGSPNTASLCKTQSIYETIEMKLLNSNLRKQPNSISKIKQRNNHNK